MPRAGARLEEVKYPGMIVDAGAVRVLIVRLYDPRMLLLPRDPLPSPP
jgi:hypothetical protein